MYVESDSSLDVMNEITFKGNTFRYLSDSALVRRSSHTTDARRMRCEPLREGNASYRYERLPPDNAFTVTVI